VRETAAAKGRRYLLEGRLHVHYVNGDEVRASCRGGGALYDLGHTGGRWYCTCPSVRLCAHLHALMLVTVPERGRAA
jgi:hypothetical protein